VDSEGSCCRCEMRALRTICARGKRRIRSTNLHGLRRWMSELNDWVEGKREGKRTRETEADRQGDKQEIIVSIDRSGLIGEKSRFADENSTDTVGETKKSELTPLASELQSIIQARGPMTVAEYSLMAIGHPDHGYYQTKEVLGRSGDFITSPEITQIFGELLGIWVIATWAQCQQPKPINLVELGPGKGTLMSDMLRAIGVYPEMLKFTRVHLVENSVKMRIRQKQTLNVTIEGEGDDEAKLAKENCKGKTDSGMEVEWHWNLSTIPEDGPIFCVCNEFFDTIPPHQFQHTDRGWCEVLVDCDFDPKGPHHLKFALAPAPGVSSLAYVGKDAASRAELVHRMPESQRLPFFEANQASPELSTESPEISRKSPENPSADLGQLAEEFGESEMNNPESKTKPLPDPGIPLGQRIEVAPLRDVIVESLAIKIKKQGGAALIIDYGEDHPQAITLQGIRGSEYASVLESPGFVDISSHVDFSALSLAARKVSTELQIFPVIPQGGFLINLNIQARMEALCKNCSEEEKQAIESAVMRLVDQEEMGLLFKVLAITQPGIGAPAGFPEDAKPI